jgi:hypothetical protein
VHMMSIQKTVDRKVKSGKYDPSLAPQLWFYLVDAGDKMYSEEYAIQRRLLSKSDRMKLAAIYAREYEDEIGI